MDGISVRELRKTSFARLNQAKDPENFQAELVRSIRGDLEHIAVCFGLFNAASNVLHVPAWLRSHLERHPGLIVKLEEGEMVGITHEPDASARRAGAARQRSTDTSAQRWPITGRDRFGITAGRPAFV